MRIVTVVGNRPQFVKAAAVSRLLREQTDELIVHTGQHYDDELSRVFFEELSVPAPDRELDAGGGTNTAQTARILGALEPVLAELSPSLVLVYGDTNSTLAGALAASQAGIPTGHVEAGMRSFDRSMPEELNRVLTDHASELLLCSTETAMANLEREGVARRVPPRGGRDGGRVARLPRHRGGALSDPRPARARAGLVPGGHRAPGRQRGPAGAARGTRGPARGAASAGGAAHAPTHARAARRRPG